MAVNAVEIGIGERIAAPFVTCDNESGNGYGPVTLGREHDPVRCRALPELL